MSAGYQRQTRERADPFRCRGGHQDWRHRGAVLGLTDKVGGTLGITNLAVDAAGTSDDTQFTVSGYLSPRLYLRYGVGIFTPVNTATIRYKISAKLYLEAVSSLENAIDLFYNLRF